MIKLAQSPWLAVALAVLSYAGTTMVFLQPNKLALASRATPNVEPASLAPLQPSWEFRNPEMDQALGEIKEERETLRARAQQLNELEARLAAERQEIAVVTQLVTRLQGEIDQMIVHAKDDEVVNLKRLGKVYANMSPEGAAKIIKELEDEQILKILMFMKEAETAPILENMGAGKGQGPNAKRAALLSDRLRLASQRTHTNAVAKGKRP